MNEFALDRAFPSTTIAERVFGTADTRRSGAFYGYSLTLIAIGVGWLLRGRGLIDPQQGLGYWLGIVGGTMMLVTILYPLRKRIRLLRFLGGTHHWFRLHMYFGILGPLLVLYHANFQLGSFNSRVALYSMLLVVASGLIGRHIYAGIHRGLYGRKTSLEELRADLHRSLELTDGLTRLMPQFTARLAALSAEVRGDEITGSLGTRWSIAWMFRRHYVRYSLSRTARRELRARAAGTPDIADDCRRLQDPCAEYVRRFVRLSGRVAKFTLYERAFSLWHVLHMPLFFTMIIAVLVHILAVHMY